MIKYSSKKALSTSIILSISVSVAFFFYFNSVNTTNAAELNFSNGKYSVTVPDSLKKEWRGNYKMPEVSLLHYRASVSELVSASLGRENNKTSEYKTYSYNPTEVYKWLEKFSVEINSPLKEGKLVVSGNRATEFVPPTPGRNLNLYESTKKVLTHLESNQPTAELAVDTVLPGPLTDTSKLGIKELIGHGESKFSGSPKNRRTNIAVGVSKMKGIIIAKGEEFSFNKYLGPVEAYAGFVPELVIKAEGTVPELGGGLCQVSSTTFRAAMDAGLPITQRKNHSYAVQYYAPQGTDATIYPGVIDLKFVNDTPGSILVWPYLKDANTLIFDFYGTKDTREVKLGTPYQYDKKSDGSMKASWSRTVTKNGKSTRQTFSSIYQPPALFHKQEKFPTPVSPNDAVPKPTLAPPVTTEAGDSNTNQQTNSNSND